jgi:hypothetical protein
MQWSANLAYIVGLIATDGCLSKDGRHIDFTSKDLDQIKNFKRILKLKNKIGIKNSGTNLAKDYYRIQFGNVNFYRFLLSIGLTPHKSKTLSKLLVPDEYYSDFVRGCFDGDGCSFSYWSKQWPNSFVFYISFCSASRNYLAWMQSMIIKLYGIKGYIGSTNGFFQLRYAKQNSLELIAKMYYSSKLVFLKRKKFKIDKALCIIQQQAGGGGEMVHAQV